MTELKKKPLFNPEGDLDVRLRRMIGGNTTNLNDFNNMKYAWVSDWYRQAMNNFWIPEEINLSQDVKDYPRLLSAERSAYDKILSFLVFLDSIQTANLPNIGAYITANEVNLCLSIQAFQECVHSQSYSYMLDTICSPVERNDILYQWKTDEHLLRRNTFIGDCYNEFQERKDAPTLLRVMMANYILEGIYFYSGFMFFYNLSRNGKMSGSAQEIRYINRDENTHLWLFRNIITELQKEQPELFTAESVQALREMMREGVEQEIAWGHYVIGDDIPGLNRQMISDYIRYLGNLRWTSLGYPALYPGFEIEPGNPAIGKALRILTKKTGIYGMLGGQCVDVEAAGREISREKLDFIYCLKTSALIEASMMVGAALAGASEAEIKVIEDSARDIGLAFQIRDDILDVTSTTDELGKSVFSDEKNDKTTYVTIEGIEKAKSDVEEISKRAVSALQSLDRKNDFLEELVLMLVNRKK